MRKLIERVRKELIEFVEQRDDLIMITSCGDNDGPIVLQILGDMEQENAADVFLLFSDDFVQADPYVSVTVERLREQHRMTSEALVERNRDPLPPFPASLLEKSRPETRLLEAISFARSLVPREGGHRLVWGMFPQRISDRKEYLRLVSSLVPCQGPKPWMAGLRMLFRDGAGTAAYAPELAAGPRVRLMDADFGPDALQSSLQEDVNEASLPLEERMQALLSTAVLDYAHHRTGDASAKYNILLGHYQNTGNQLMQAFVINAMGDIFHREGDLGKALWWYECAVPPAAAAKEPLILSTITRNLADVSFKLGRHEEAEQYYDGIVQLSAVTLDPGTKINALEWRGLSQERQGNYQAAIESLEAASLLSRNMDLTSFESENVKHLARVYRVAGRPDLAEAAEAECKRIQLQEASR